MTRLDRFTLFFLAIAIIFGFLDMRLRFDRIEAMLQAGTDSRETIHEYHEHHNPVVAAGVR